MWALVAKQEMQAPCAHMSYILQSNCDPSRPSCQPGKVTRSPTQLRKQEGFQVVRAQQQGSVGVGLYSRAHLPLPPVPAGPLLGLG